MLNAIQTWAADRGYGQYPVPRGRPLRGRPDEIGLRLVMVVLGLFGVIIFGALVLGMIAVAAAFIYAAFTG